MSKLILEPQVQVEPSEEVVTLEAENEILSIADTATTGIIDAAKEEQPVGSLNRKWIESFRSLAESPVSYGAVAGQVAAAIFGGSEAGAAATPIAQSFHKMANDRYESSKKITADLVKAEEESKLKRATANNFSISASLVDKNGNPVLADKRTGKFFSNGSEIPASEVRSITAEESTRKQVQGDVSRQQRDVALGQASDRIELAKERFGFTKEEANELSVADARYMGDASATMDAADKVVKMFKDVNTGPASGRAQRLAQVFGVAPGDFVAARSQAALFLGDYVRLMSGAAATDNERAFYERNLPTDKDTESDLIRKAELVKKYVRDKASNRLEAMRKFKGQGKDVKLDDRSNKPSSLESKSKADQIKAASEWLKNNKNDPRAPEVLKKLKKLQGR